MQITHYKKFMVMAAAFICTSAFAVSDLPKIQTAKLGDVTVTSNVQAKLATDPALSGVHVYVTTRKGVVSLSGTLNNKNQLRSAIEDAVSATGVHKVKSTHLILQEDNQS